MGQTNRLHVVIPVTTSFSSRRNIGRMVFTRSSALFCVALSMSPSSSPTPHQLHTKRCYSLFRCRKNLFCKIVFRYLIGGHTESPPFFLLKYEYSTWWWHVRFGFTITTNILSIRTIPSNTPPLVINPLFGNIYIYLKNIVHFHYFF